MAGADRQTFGVPVAHRRLGRGRFGETTMGAEGVHYPTELRGCCDIAAEHPARDEPLTYRIHTLPRGQHVQDGTIDGFVRYHLHQVTHGQFPRGVFPVNEVLHILTGDISELLSAFVGVQLPEWANGSQQGQRQGPRKISAHITIWAASFG